MYNYYTACNNQLITSKTKETGGEHVLSSNKSKYYPFCDSKSEWYQRHETLWEKFIKDHLLIGKQGFVEENTFIKKYSTNQSQHFHVDPSKCKEINIDIKTDGDKSVSIAFVTSETNLQKFEPRKIFRCNKPVTLNSRKETKATKAKGVADGRLLKEKSGQKYKLTKERKSKDISTDTKSLECFHGRNNLNRQNNSEKETYAADNQVIPSESVTNVFSLEATTGSFLSAQNLQKVNSKSKLSFPTNKSVNCGKDLCHRTVSSKLLFQKPSPDFTNLSSETSGTNSNEEELKNLNTCVKLVEDLRDKKTLLPDQSFIGTDEKADEAKTYSNDLKKISSYITPENKNTLLKSSSSSLKKPSLLKIKKNKSGKTNSSSEKTDIINNKKQEKAKNSSVKQSHGNESYFGINWSDISKKFNLFGNQKQHKHKERHPFTLKRKDKEQSEKDRKETSSGEESTLNKSRKLKIENKNKLKSKTFEMPSCRCKNDDAGDADQYVRFRDCSYRVRHRSPSISKSKSKDVARYCVYCNKSKEKWDKPIMNAFPPVSDSAFFGPTLDEAITNFISCLPSKILKRLGFFHESNTDPDSEDPLTRDDLITCESDLGEQKYKSKCGNFIDEDDVLQWLNNEYMQLASELAEAKRNPRGKMSPELYESRRFVLDRVQEILQEKRYIEEEKERQKERIARKEEREKKRCHC